MLVFHLSLIPLFKFSQLAYEMGDMDPKYLPYAQMGAFVTSFASLVSLSTGLSIFVKYALEVQGEYAVDSGLLFAAWALIVFHCIYALLVYLVTGLHMYRVVNTSSSMATWILHIAYSVINIGSKFVGVIIIYRVQPPSPTSMSVRWFQF